MKRLMTILILVFLSSTAIVFAADTKDHMYYKSQIQNLRYTYNLCGMFDAIFKNDTKVLELYLKDGFSPNSTFAANPAVMYALFYNKLDAFKMLLEYGADPETSVPPCFVSAKSQNLLSFAIKRENSEAVKILIENNVDVNKKTKKDSPLNMAIKKKQAKIVELLLTAGAKPDEKTYKLVNKTKDEYIKSLFE